MQIPARRQHTSQFQYHLIWMFYMLQNGIALNALENTGAKRQSLRACRHMHPRQNEQIDIHVPFRFRTAATYIKVPAAQRKMESFRRIAYEWLGRFQ